MRTPPVWAASVVGKEYSVAAPSQPTVTAGWLDVPVTPCARGSVSATWSAGPTLSSWTKPFDRD
jgi:hypothetical protein